MCYSFFRARFPLGLWENVDPLATLDSRESFIPIESQQDFSAQLRTIRAIDWKINTICFAPGVTTYFYAPVARSDEINVDCLGLI